GCNRRPIHDRRHRRRARRFHVEGSRALRRRALERHHERARREGSARAHRACRRAAAVGRAARLRPHTRGERRMSFVIVVGVLVLMLVVSSFKVLNEYERGVMFFLGRLGPLKGPGIVWVWPIIQRMVKVDLRVIVLDVPKQDVILRDNVSVKVNAVVYFRIVDPGKAIIQVESVFEATSQLAQTTLRSVLGQHELDDLLAQRDKLNAELQRTPDKSREHGGIRVENVEIKGGDPEETMFRERAKRGEAGRPRRAKIIHAEGEKQAATMLVEAAA